MSFCPSEISSCPKDSAVFLHRVDVWLPTRGTQLQVTFLDATVDFVEGKLFFKVLLSPCDYINGVCMKASREVPYEHSKVIQQWLLSLASTLRTLPQST